MFYFTVCCSIVCQNALCHFVYKTIIDWLIEHCIGNDKEASFTKTTYTKTTQSPTWCTVVHWVHMRLSPNGVSIGSSGSGGSKLQFANCRSMRALRTNRPGFAAANQNEVRPCDADAREQWTRRVTGPICSWQFNRVRELGTILNVLLMFCLLLLCLASTASLTLRVNAEVQRNS